MSVKTSGGIDETDDLNHPFDSIKTPRGGPYSGQSVEQADAGGLVSLLCRQVGADGALEL